MTNKSLHKQMLLARKRRDAEIVRMAKTQTQEAIAKHMGMTRQRVSQILKESRK